MVIGRAPSSCTHLCPTELESLELVFVGEDVTPTRLFEVYAFLIVFLLTQRSQKDIEETTERFFVSRFRIDSERLDERQRVQLDLSVIVGLDVRLDRIGFIRR